MAKLVAVRVQDWIETKGLYGGLLSPVATPFLAVRKLGSSFRARCESAVAAQRRAQTDLPKDGTVILRASDEDARTIPTTGALRTPEMVFSFSSHPDSYLAVPFNYCNKLNNKFGSLQNSVYESAGS